MPIADLEDPRMPASPDPAGERLAELFRAWKKDVSAAPTPLLVDPVRAASIIAEARASGCICPPTAYAPGRVRN
ncbi:hypothetical protein AVL48_21340 [Amycolatopsis regifaucium]|uniref:Uncharacterized protein n=1 Tax=Amycolatopsis regifaucium TaxID=546365 RepID=A0A154MSI2_9PSEU|nr:hypothetical protein AVL48_21340 [Amycolatopsis regifaucium]OKA08045.1 hypothetical protein ATP06_0212100 [Amycolatopsis regifaucium]